MYLDFIARVGLEGGGRAYLQDKNTCAETLAENGRGAYTQAGAYLWDTRGSLHTSQISHLLLFPSLWLLAPGSCSQFLPLFPLQPAFEISTGL